MSAIRVHRVLSARDRERLRRQIDEKRRELRGEIVVPRHPNGKEEGLSERRMGRYAQFMDRNVQVDRNLLQGQIRHLERVLSNGSPDSLNGAQKRALEKRIEADREFLRRNMCPKTIFHAGYKHPDFEKAKKACQREHQRDFQVVAERYQNSMRQMDPENPDAANVERIRPD